RGLDDLIYLNRDGFLTESTRANLFVERDGRLLTPALRHGLLPGVLRRELIEAGRAIEADLRPQDLAGTRWFLGNSLRELQEATTA
ncbi:MAG: aminodeoxychorismate synthase, component I, partial [Phyllobacteriaceae bacterium]|nr:aminodeoxychorismate synthase, component I [Phyllobacteriaceae bacterium]